jgi:hypothetical protein
MHVHLYNEAYLPVCYDSNYRGIQKEEIPEDTWDYIRILPATYIQAYPPNVNHNDIILILITASI